MRKTWLIFAQTVTVSLAVLFVISTLKPEWLGHRASVVALQEAAPAAADGGAGLGGFREAVRRSLPSVVYIFTSKEVKSSRHPLFDDPVFRHFFGDRFDNEPQR